MNMERRKYGIDVLRFLATVGVIILHLLGTGLFKKQLAGGGGYILYNYNFCAFIEILCFCSVNLFGIITGYLYSQRKKYHSITIIRLIITLLFYSFLITFIVKSIEPQWIHSEKHFIDSLFPLGTRLWYITAYIFIFFMIPYLNIFLQNLDKNTNIRLIFLLLFFLSICPIIGCKDYFKIHNGYSCFWLIACYFIGAFILKYKILIHKVILFVICMTNIFIVFGLGYYVQNYNISWCKMFYKQILTYNSPFIVANSVCFFLLLKDIKVNSIFKKILELLSKTSLAIYIIHAHGLILDNIIYKIMPPYLHRNPIIFITLSGIIILGIISFCVLIDYIKNLIEENTKIIWVEKTISYKLDRLLGYIEQ